MSDGEVMAVGFELKTCPGDGRFDIGNGPSGSTNDIPPQSVDPIEGTGCDAACPIQIYVEPGGACGGKVPCFPALQAGLDAAVSGDSLLVGQGVYDEQVEIDYAPSTEVSIRGGWTTDFSSRGEPKLTISPHDPSASSVLRRLTIRGGRILID